ncbi:hypothetical protein QOZ80_8AG0634170 [Eleusine coracana subsp. coracana]|nr:hypothetical protein QOZ80_8AG0634170 [Eleusine coracana subsp. coracana]
MTQLGRTGNTEEPHSPMIADLFATPPQALVPPQQPPPKRRKQHTTAVSTVQKRSARIAKQPAMPAIERAKRNLLCQLGLLQNAHQSIEQVLKEYIAMFQGPLPPDIIAALTALFDLDNEDAGHINDALLRHAGEGVDELQEAVTGVA